MTPTPYLTDTLAPDSGIHVSSPNGRIQVTFMLENGVPYYKVNYSGQDIIRPSKLGFAFKDAEPLNQNLTITDNECSSFDETWIQPWGEVKEIRNHYNELRVDLEETAETHRKMTVVFRVYDDGLGFRYELPEQDNLSDFQIMDEETEFVLTGDHRAWWIPAYLEERYEYLYRKTPISYLRKVAYTVHTPLTLETADGLFLSIHEANLTDYASMTLMASDNNTLLCDLVPWSDGVKVKASTPHQTPWRTIQIAENAGDLITSYLILNLNEPNKLEDVSWVEPGKYVGIWWGMHIGKYTWGSYRHGATTENTRRYIDFAAKHGFSRVLVEGWNVGWDGNWSRHGDLFSFTTPYEDFDIEELSAYAAARGVKLIGHHETAAAVTNYERQLEDAFDFYRDLGIDTVKTGYVGCGQGIKRRDEEGNLVGLEWHHGQYMVRHYRKVVETAARYQIMLDVHEPIKDTGIRRTYPNMMTREGARGQEYNAWSEDGGNPPEHTTILPFTRMLAGPFDFTPGIFDLLFEEYRLSHRVNTTLAKQLALYVVIYSPLHMAADLPENYEGHPAFQFIIDVPVDWQDTKVLHAEIGDYVTIVRQNRNSEDWYLGSITDEERRTLEAPLTFLEPGRKYVAEVYADTADADWESNPLSIDIYEVLVDTNTTLRLRLAPGGGQAIRIRPSTEDEANHIPPYQP
ncbi:MAG: glycoside hydrolase family 97 protein [Chloroflexi bacterium]|nr:glycoside hydrolase family 97 protein [Chloroflexota bacterium]